MHQVVMSLAHSCSIGYVFSGAINMERSCSGQSLLNRGLAGKLMRKLLLCSHSSRMFPRSLSQPFIALKGGNSSFCSHLIGQGEELVLGIRLVGKRKLRDGSHERRGFRFPSFCWGRATYQDNRQRGNEGPDHRKRTKYLGAKQSRSFALLPSG